MLSDDDDIAPRRSQPGNATPRRSAAIKRQNATPRKNAPAKKPATPRDAPPRATSGQKKHESTLLGDFLLGRPSPKRAQRKSPDGGKLEMRQASVNKLKPPGRVQDRVKEWRKANATALISDPITPASEPDEAFVRVDDTSVDEVDRQKIKHRGKIRPTGKKESREEGGQSPDARRLKNSPKKRVVSDDHWMNKKSSPRTPDTKAKGGSPLPKDFVSSFSSNPPLKRKLDDWLRRTVDETHTPRDSNPRANPKGLSSGDGIRVYPSRHRTDDLHHESPIKQKQFDDGIRVRPIEPDEPRRKTRRKSDLEPHDTTRRQFSKPQPSSPEFIDPPSKPEARQNLKFDNPPPPPSWTLPSRPSQRTDLYRRSASPESLGDIPVGRSAFSVLEIPVGADANVLRRQRPQRNPSFAAVPKVLKQVYSEGLKRVHETVDPPRMGINQPPSIESWLKGTSDPFEDSSVVPETSPELGIPFSHEARNAWNGSQSIPIPQKQAENPSEEKTEMRSKSRLREDLHRPRKTEDEEVTGRTSPPQEEITPVASPGALKRSSAARNAASPKASGRAALKETVRKAFQGVSEPLSFKKPILRPDNGFQSRERSDGQSDDHYKAGSKAYGRNSDLENLSEESVSRNIDSNRDSEHDVQPPKYRCHAQDPNAATTTQHRLSTILSVESFAAGHQSPETVSTCSHITSSSIVSDSTITVTNFSDGKINQSIGSSKNQPRSRESRHRTKGPGLKRRLTKHSDLLSILSVEDPSVLGKSKSIRSARSVRTTRNRCISATASSLLQELAEDEVKYMRELKTLVDGVIPVLLTSVLSKTDSAVAAGIFNSLTGGISTESATKPIVDIGIALEKLKNLHRRIPTYDATYLINWADTAHKVYEDYLTAWRMGFQDVIVNLAPASPSEEDQSLLNGGMARDAAGDVLNEDGERVDVAFLLKRPLVRIKYLSKLFQGLQRLQTSSHAADIHSKFESLVERTRIRIKEEVARLEDLAASNTDATRARDPRSLAPVDWAQIDKTRQVKAKDFFELDIQHSNGQKIGCRVECLLRDKPRVETDPGDLLICEVDHLSRWLLFPPLELKNISARLDDDNGRFIMMIRGVSGGSDWHELLVLAAESDETAREWVEMFGSHPTPPRSDGRPYLTSTTTSPLRPLPSSCNTTSELGFRPASAEVEIPIGETRRKKNSLERDSSRQINARHVQMDDSRPLFEERDSSNGRHQSRSPLKTSTTPAREEVRLGSSASPVPSSPDLLHSRRTKEEAALHDRRSPLSKQGSIERDDGAPPPPVHRISTASGRKKSPVLNTRVSPPHNRKSSSPLKHEYQPSDGSSTSSFTGDSGSDYGMIDSDSSEEEELEAVDAPMPHPGLPMPYVRKKIPILSVYSSVAPSQSASQAPYHDKIIAETQPSLRLVASISCWSETGHWKELHPEDCSIIIGPGFIEAHFMGTAHSGAHGFDPIGSLGTSDINAGNDAGAERPLVALELTPCVPLRQSNALDIEIRSPPTAQSVLDCTPTVRFRSRTPKECSALYAAIHESRMNNPIYKRLEQERIVSAYGVKSYQAATGKSRRVSWFGRKKSYRVTARAPSSATVSDNSSSSFSSKIARLRNIGGAGGFNIDKSTIATNQGPGTVSGSNSLYMSSSESGASGSTPPHTSISPSVAQTAATNIPMLGRSNLKIRLYVLETSSKWNELGSALLTVSEPPPGMRQASSLYHGVEKRILVTSESKRSLEFISAQNNGTSGDSTAVHVVIDQVLGGKCFSRLGVVGIAMNVWEDIMGDNGEVGRVAAVGGVSGRTRKWMFQCATAKEASWIFSLVGGCN